MNEFDPNTQHQRDTRFYYENESRLRLRKPLRGRRVELRSDFLSLLENEDRNSVLDFGAGPGWDGEAFHGAGLRFVGVDLAAGNGRLAAERGLVVTTGSVAAMPIKSSSFDAGWSMSSLMHLSDGSVEKTVSEMVRTLRPGSPIMTGSWGSEIEAIEAVTSDQVGGQRVNHLRCLDHNRTLLEQGGTVERAEQWRDLKPGLDYQVFLIRTPR